MAASGKRSTSKRNSLFGQPTFCRAGRRNWSDHLTIWFACQADKGLCQRRVGTHDQPTPASSWRYLSRSSGVAMIKVSRMPAGMSVVSV